MIETWEVLFYEYKKQQHNNNACKNITWAVTESKQIWYFLFNLTSIITVINRAISINPAPV